MQASNTIAILFKANADTQPRHSLIQENLHYGKHSIITLITKPTASETQYPKQQNPNRPDESSFNEQAY